MNFQALVPFLPIIIGILTASTALFGFLWQRQTERLKIIEQQLSQSKYKAYAELVTTFYDILKDVKKEENTNTNDLMVKIIESKKDFFIYGSDEVFKKLIAWLVYSSTHEGDLKHINYFLDLMLEIRKDMGHKKTKLTHKDIMISLMQNEKEYEAFKELLK